MSICRHEPPSSDSEPVMGPFDLVSTPPLPKWLVEGVVPEGVITFLSGEDTFHRCHEGVPSDLVGMGPLRLTALQMLVAVATGGLWLGGQANRGKVLWIMEWQCFEAKWFLYHVLRQSTARTHGCERIDIISADMCWLDVRRPTPSNPVTSIGVDETWLAGVGNQYRLIVIDDQTRALPRSMEAKSLLPWMGRLLSAAYAAQCTVVRLVLVDRQEMPQWLLSTDGIARQSQIHITDNEAEVVRGYNGAPPGRRYRLRG